VKKVINLEWNVLINLLDPKLLIVLAACWVFGFILKQTPKVPNWSIVYFVTGMAIVSSVMILGVSTLSVLQGFIAGAAAVYGYELAKNTVKGIKESGD
jgi:hypothetical protein